MKHTKKLLSLLLAAAGAVPDPESVVHGICS